MKQRKQEYQKNYDLIMGFKPFIHKFPDPARATAFFEETERLFKTFMDQDGSYEAMEMANQQEKAWFDDFQNEIAFMHECALIGQEEN